MNVLTWLKRNRTTLTILLAATGIAIMLLYTYCDTACSYLRGDILGIDLKVIGIVYMLLIIGLTIGGEMGGTRMLLASGLGVEAHLFYFQHKEEVYCPFCLAFAVTLIFRLRVESRKARGRSQGPQGSRDRHPGRGGDPLTKVRVPLLLMTILGYLFITLTFSGSSSHPPTGRTNPPSRPSARGPAR